MPGPRGQAWRGTAIRGHRRRGRGILNNQMYIGRLVFNRLIHRKNPLSERRVFGSTRQSNVSFKRFLRFALFRTHSGKK
ncbi:MULTISPECIES: recombinase family protein [Rhizobium]|uniref:recombinase family protein n=1 Tax=Rhizobium TaxID=379 RepID=UPI002961F996|nr:MULTISPECIES: recombinase family protein [Rhizobium]WSG92438.1 recombinase family protein [Rhizobium beringeri]WSH29674.1 recombinase family protein [Rhizobium beringeri]WSH48565.1 recombinase family protein [Rhizobium johnstonii]WSH68654.1 recombinase family protein [Rhizobium ruizarguesonis]WSH84360.1 recombinase family protein [Rhizobium beringeri]